MRRRLRLCWFSAVGSKLVPVRVRVRLYRWSGITVGHGTGVMSDVDIDGTRLTVGRNCFINRFCRFDTYGAEVRIEDNVYLGHGVSVITSSHAAGTHMLRAGHNTYAPVTIGKGCWIGANSTILPGVTIGSGCVIAAGSVVTHDTGTNRLIAGVPAALKRALA